MAVISQFWGFSIYPSSAVNYRPMLRVDGLFLMMVEVFSLFPFCLAGYLPRC